MKTTVRPDFVFEDETLNRLDFPEKQVITLTCHRRENYGAPMEAILTAVRTIVEENPNVEVVYPVHLSPVVQDCAHRLLGDHPRIHLIAPLDVAQMHNLMARSYLVLTDSGGLQEEAPALGKPVLVLRRETAAGKYPVAAVKNMAEIAEYTEKHISYIHRFHTTEFEIHSNLDAVSHATCAMAIDVGAKCIVVSSMSGRTARMVSRFRCPADIVGMTTTERAWRKLALSWGVTPVLSEEFNSMDVMFYHALHQAKRVCHLEKGDNVVLTGGQINGHPGNTNTIKVETIK